VESPPTTEVSRLPSETAVTTTGVKSTVYDAIFSPVSKAQSYISMQNAKIASPN